VVHERVGVRLIWLAPSAGLGELTAAGGAVVNDQTGPMAAPALLLATMCQKYVALFPRGPGPQALVVRPTPARNGGLLEPKLTS
jgi:hypothetical protein